MYFQHPPGWFCWPTRQRRLGTRWLISAMTQKDIDRGQLALKLKNISRMGFEEVESYMVKGVYNLSAPILDPNGRAVAALTIPFLAKLNSTRTERRQARAHLAEIARELTISIGGTEYLESWWTRDKVAGHNISCRCPPFVFILDMVLLTLLFSLYNPLTSYNLTSPKSPIHLWGFHY